MADNFIGKAIETGSNIYNRTIGRLLGAGIGKDFKIAQAQATWVGRSAGEKDWRVKLTLPPMSDLRHEFFNNNALLKPLQDAGGFHWPLTPSMVIQHTANYNALAQTHSNYPFQAYQNSQVDQLNIIGEFPVQNTEDARYWVATINFLRGITKMFFGKQTMGQDNYKGNPPPIMHLNGYGDHMFRNVPVIVNTFNVELRAGTDYISTNDDVYSARSTNTEVASLVRKGIIEDNEISATWAPTLSNISVLVTPIYSRDTIGRFNLQKFMRGELNGKGDEIGFI